MFCNFATGPKNNQQSLALTNTCQFLIKRITCSWMFNIAFFFLKMKVLLHYFFYSPRWLNIYRFLSC